LTSCKRRSKSLVLIARAAVLTTSGAAGRTARSVPGEQPVLILFRLFYQVEIRHRQLRRDPRRVGK
jgi:hypothetical protein